MTAVFPAWLRNDLADAAARLREQESQRTDACGLCRPFNPCWWHRYGPGSAVDGSVIDRQVRAALDDREFVHAESSRVYARIASAVRNGLDDAPLAAMVRAEVATRSQTDD